jgi:hypothetical protein
LSLVKILIILTKVNERIINVMNDVNLKIKKRSKPDNFDINPIIYGSKNLCA